MKTQNEINENIAGCKVKLQENVDNESKFEMVMTPQMRQGYLKTRAYIRGWIDALENTQSSAESPEYESGYKNANDWRNRD